MRRITLARAALAAMTISVPVAATAVGAMGAASAAVTGAGQPPAAAAKSHPESFNQKVATYVKRLEGAPYVYGGTTPAGFDCSGLTRYAYHHFGKHIARTAEAQFREFRRIGKSRVRGGDLVFFHVSSDPGSYVYHVGVYERGSDMVAASTGAGSVIWESFSWAGDTVTYGTITH
ncbi:MAG: C40 family peptidase [Trebonia sp.]